MNTRNVIWPPRPEKDTHFCSNSATYIQSVSQLTYTVSHPNRKLHDITNEKQQPRRVPLINFIKSCANFNNLKQSLLPAKLIIGLAHFVQRPGSDHGLFAAGCTHPLPFIPILDTGDNIHNISDYRLCHPHTKAHIWLSCPAALTQCVTNS